jgi:hypothetical protein
MSPERLRVDGLMWNLLPNITAAKGERDKTTVKMLHFNSFSIIRESYPRSTVQHCSLAQILKLVS